MNSRAAIARTQRWVSQSGTRIALVRHATAKRVTLAIALLAGSAAQAAGIATQVLDREGRPIDEVVVVAAPVSGGSPARGANATAIMDQQNLAFVPQVLVVATGTSVSFPNSDSVSHQVYSFSPAKRFQLPLYKGETHPPVVFDHSGLVVLGCNIHDSMVGYIYVTDAPYFGKTDRTGSLRLGEMEPGRYRVTAWSPRIADPPTALTREVVVAGGGDVKVEIRLTAALRARPEPRPRHSDWDY